MKCIAIISSPLQILNFNEYVNNNDINKFLLIILVYNKKELIRIKKLIDLYKISSYKIIKGKFFIQYYSLYALAKKISKTEKLIIGNFFSDPHLYFANRLNFKEILVLDDGINTTLIPKFIATNKKILRSSYIRNLIFKFFNINVDYPHKISLFTIFKKINSEYIKVLPNNLSLTKKMISNIDLRSQVFFIGQPLVELGIIDKSNYFKCLEKLKSKYLSLTYIPSRKESKLKIKEIEKKIGCRVIYPQINIEIYFILNKFLPKKVFSFTSSALILLELIYNTNSQILDINSIRMKFKNNRLKSSIIEDYYRALKDYKINIINL